MEWNGFLANLMVDGIALGAANALTLVNSIRTELSRTNALASGYTDYKGAKIDLLLQLGRYCFYCESKHQDGQDLAIEHRIPKDHYCTEYLRWDNFVLGCAICNSNYKGANPSRTDGINQAMKNHPGAGFVNLVQPKKGDQPAAPFIDPPANTVRLPYHEILQAAQDYHLWPDVSEVVPGTASNPASLSLRLCNYQLHEVDAAGNSLGVILYPLATDLNNRRDQVSQDQILQTYVWDSTIVPAGGLRQMFVQVRIAVRNANTESIILIIVKIMLQTILFV